MAKGNSRKNPDTEEIELVCYCAGKCGVEGKKRSPATWYRHNPTEKALAKRAAKLSGSVSQGSPTSAPAAVDALELGQLHQGSAGQGSSRQAVAIPSDGDAMDIEARSPFLSPYTEHPPPLPMDIEEPMHNNEQPIEYPEQNDDGMSVDPTAQNNGQSRSPSPLLPNPPPDEEDEELPRAPSPTDDPLSEPYSRIEDFQIANKFIDALRGARLDDETEGLDPEVIHQLRNPPQCPPKLDADERLSIDIFLAVSNASVETYNAVRDAILRRRPDDVVLTYHAVKKLVRELSGIVSVTRDMCINSCMAYTGPFSKLDCCPYDGESRYNPKYAAAQVPRLQFNTILVGPQLQALRRSPEGAAELRYRKRITQAVLDDLDKNDGVKTRPYTDFFDGDDYLDALEAGKIKDGDNVLMLSVDGAQLYRNKTSDCWIAAWIVLDRETGMRYKKKAILPATIIPGKPKNIDSFLFTTLYHLAALQHEGLPVWDAIDRQILNTHPFFALGTADGPGMACISGCVGHHGKNACRLYCKLKGRHKVGGSHYYPVRFKPDQYAVAGCDHGDVHLGPLLDGFTPEDAAVRYRQNVRKVGAARNKTDYEKLRLETGISKPTIFSGLPSQHRLEIPACFGLDYMHAPSLNLTDLLPSLWRGTFDCEKTDNKDTWRWVVLTAEVWKRHGQAVADCTPWIPGSFDRPPRNPAEKINSGYKAWEWLLYFYGLGPALLYGILPDEQYKNYCKVVRAIRIQLQEEIPPEENLESHQCFSEFSDEFENIYVQRRADRMHFVRPVVHTLSHMPGETTRKGPGNIYSQWALERTIGNLGEEIKQHSNAYANLSQRAIRRAQVNALKNIIPDLERDNTTKLPRGSVDLGDGYVLLTAQDTCRRLVRPCEEEAVREYLEDEFDVDAAEDWRPSVVRWARVRLPNGQVIRSLWKEQLKIQLRAARHVKVQVNARECEFAEVLYFFNDEFNGQERHLAVCAFFGPPDAHLLEISCGTYWSVKHQRDADTRAIDVKKIVACVMMAPDYQYKHYRTDGSEIDRWFLMEKPGLKLASWTGPGERMDED